MTILLIIEVKMDLFRGLSRPHLPLTVKAVRSRSGINGTFG